MPAKKFVQENFDVTKWVESEAAGEDKCGTYEFCKYCDKSAENPCEAAYAKAKATKKPATKKAPAKKTTKSSTK